MAEKFVGWPELDMVIVTGQSVSNHLEYRWNAVGMQRGLSQCMGTQKN